MQNSLRTTRTLCRRFALSCAALTALFSGLVWPLWSSQLQPVSLLSPGQPPAAGGNGDSALPVLSPEGRFVLFASTADNLVLGTNGLAVLALVPARFNVFLRDRVTQTTRLVSENVAGSGGGNGDSVPIALSTNGQFALFESSASDLVPGDTNGVTDIFLCDLAGGQTLLVSVNTNGLPGNGASRNPSMTPDGQRVVFVSEASDLVAGDTNRIPDVFVWDLAAPSATLVSVGARSTNTSSVVPASSSESPEISHDGRYVAFSSTATNLVPGVRTVGEIYLRDLISGTTTWASADMRTRLQSVTGKTNGLAFNLALSADGKFVAYEASLSPLPASTNAGILLRYARETGFTDLIHTNAATALFSVQDTRNLDLTPDGQVVAFAANTNGVSGASTAVLIWDAVSGTTTLASGDLGGGVATNALALNPVLAAAGTAVAFLSSATNLVTNTIPDGWHLYVRHLQTGTTTLVDADPTAPAGAISPATVPSLSADGSLIAFEAADGGLVASDRNRASDVFVQNLILGTNELVSAHHPALGSATPNGPSSLGPLAASEDGRFVAFASDADNVVAGDTNGFRDVFLSDLAGGAPVLISGGLADAGANGSSGEAAVDGSGRWVAFSSTATNLAANDANNASDVFVRDVQTGTTVLASVRTNGTGAGNKASYSPTISTDGRWLLFRSLATDIAAGSFGSQENLFLRDLQIGTNRALTTAGVSAHAMTPDGTRVVFASGNPSTALYVWNSLTGTRSYTNTTASIKAVAIRPDGQGIAHAGAQLVIRDLALNTAWTAASLASGSRAAPRFSANGRWLTSARTVSGTNQVFLYDLENKVEVLVSHAAASALGGYGESDASDLSADGRFVVYRTEARNLVPGVTGFGRQLVLYDRLSAANTLLTASRLDGGAARDFSLAPVFTRDGQVILFQSWAPDLVAGDFNRTGDVLRYALLNAVLIPAAPGQGPWVQWPVVPGNAYRVEFKDRLDDPAWQELTGPVVTHGIRAAQQDPAPASAHRFYRVVAP